MKEKKKSEEETKNQRHFDVAKQSHSKGINAEEIKIRPDREKKNGNISSDDLQKTIFFCLIYAC